MDHLNIYMRGLERNITIWPYTIYNTNQKSGNRFVRKYWKPHHSKHPSMAFEMTDWKKRRNLYEKYTNCHFWLGFAFDTHDRYERCLCYFAVAASYYGSMGSPYLGTPVGVVTRQQWEYNICIYLAPVNRSFHSLYRWRRSVELPYMQHYIMVQTPFWNC